MPSFSDIRVTGEKNLGEVRLAKGELGMVENLGIFKALLSNFVDFNIDCLIIVSLKVF